MLVTATGIISGMRSVLYSDCNENFIGFKTSPQRSIDKSEEKCRHKRVGYRRGE